MSFPLALTIPNFHIDFALKEVDPNVFASRTKLMLDGEQIGLVVFFSLSQGMDLPYPTLELQFTPATWEVLQSHPQSVQEQHVVTRTIRQYWDGSIDEKTGNLVVRFPVRVV